MLARTSSSRPFSVIASIFCLFGVCGSASAQSIENGKPVASPFEQWDTNSDGFLSRDEFPKRFPAGLFKRIDQDRDGRLSRTEDDRFRESRRSG